MPQHIILTFPLPPASLDPPRGVCKMGRINMVSKHRIYRVEITNVQSMQNELRSHGTYAHSLVSGTLIEYLLIADIPLFWAL